MDNKSVVALGRPFSLGMLYDMRRDALIPAITLWDPELLKKEENMTSQPQPYTHCDFEAGDNYKNKIRLMNVGGSMKLNLLGGLLDISGSAKYVNDTKDSARTIRMTLTYETTTRFDALSMKHLTRENIKYGQVFEDDSATHVVTGITYGAKAYFVFERETSDTEDKTVVEGHMKLKLKDLPIYGKVNVDISDTEKKEESKIKCKFYGDFNLKSNPSTYEQAMNTYHELPKLLGPNDEKAVPMKVWLYPLHKLNDHAARMRREISQSMIQQTTEICEDMQGAREQCYDLMNNEVINHFTIIKTWLMKFESHRELCMNTFKSKLLVILPTIFGAEDGDERELAELISSHQKGPLNTTAMNRWLDEREEEMAILEAYTELLGDTEFMTKPGQLPKILIKKSKVVSLEFNLRTNDHVDEYLEAMNLYIEGKLPEGANRNFDTTLWFRNSTIMDPMRETITLFAEQKSQRSPKIEFVVSVKSGTEYIGCYIHYYRNGKTCTKEDVVETEVEKEVEETIPDLRLLWTIESYRDIHDVAILPGGDVVAACWGGGLHVYNGTGELDHPLTTGSVYMQGVITSRDGTVVAAVEWDATGQLHVYTQMEGDWSTKQITICTNPISVAMVTGGFIVSGLHKSLYKYSTDGQQMWRRTLQQDAMSLCVADDNRIWARMRDRTVHIYSKDGIGEVIVSTGAEEEKLKARGISQSAGQVFIVDHTTCSVLVYDEQGQFLRSTLKLAGEPEAIDVRDGHMVVCVNRDNNSILSMYKL